MRVFLREPSRGKYVEWVTRREDDGVSTSGCLGHGMVLKPKFDEARTDLISRIARTKLRQHDGVRVTLRELSKDWTDPGAAALSDIPRNQFVLHVLVEDA